MLSEEGTIYRDGERTVVEVPWKQHLAELPGVEVVDHEEGQRCRKIFVKKRIYLPEELERAVREVLEDTDVLRLAMNGFSVLTPEQCAVWGVQVGTYERAVAALLKHITLAMMREFSGIDVRYLHGASNMGVDAAIQEVADKLNRKNLGFSCPKFMLYVLDDARPVYVAATQASYAEAFARSAHILIAVNGRAQALQHDLMAALLYNIRVILVNILRTISTNGGPPAIGPDGKIEDAVDAFQLRVHAIGQHRDSVGNTDRWKETVRESAEIVAGACRQILSPSRGLNVRID